MGICCPRTPFGLPEKVQVAFPRAGRAARIRRRRLPRRQTDGATGRTTCPQKRRRPNTAFFGSGRTDGIGGQHIAADIAKSNGGTTLEMLIEARKIIMPTWDQNNQASIKAWEDISSEYTTCASGTVTGVIGKDLRPGNIWENRELPALKNIPNITIIVIIDPKTKISTVIFQR